MPQPSPSAPPAHLRVDRFDSPVGSWTLWQWTPAPDLLPAIVGLWATSATTVAFRERVVPRETVELMVNFGGRQAVHWPGRTDRPEYFRRAWVSGLQTACLDIESPTAPELVAASLHPAHAGPLLAVAGRELCGRVVELDEILGRLAEDLAERLEQAPSMTDRFLRFEEFLRARLRRSRQTVPAVTRAVDLIRARGGRISAASLRGEIGCSARYLETQLAEHVGVAPKQLSRLVRFSRAVERVRTTDHVEWADVAAACGFYDQSHFTREFRRFTGATPGEFLARRDPSGQALLDG